MPPGVRVSVTAYTIERSQKGIRADRPAPRQATVFQFCSERLGSIWNERSASSGPPACVHSFHSISRAVVSLGDDKPLIVADPIRAPPGAWSEWDWAMLVKRVIPTPIAIELTDFQIL